MIRESNPHPSPGKLAPVRTATCPRTKSWSAGLLAIAAVIVALPAAEIRQVGNFNREWLFQPGDRPGAETAGFDDAQWEHIGLPHPFSIPYFAAGNAFYVGYGWYRKHFDVPAMGIGRRLFLDFDGAFQDAEIFLNGRKVGTHQGGVPVT